ncbi:MAG: thiamine-phosphate kinase [Bacteroidota bacterium]
MNKDTKTGLTSIAELGEFGLIDHLTKKFSSNQNSTIKAIGDDAAILQYGKEQVVITTDLLLEGIHFNLTYTPLKHLGYKAVAVNLSDVYAMNATPRQITVSLGVSQKLAVEHMDELYEGIALACERYNVDLVGGDTSASMTGLTLSITALGTAPADKIVRRDAAKTNNLICVSGNLGGAYMGLQLLEREKDVFQSSGGGQPKLEGFEYILQRQLKPEPRQEVIQLLEKLDIRPTAMIDISDGLSSELMHICSKSGKGCRIYQDKIPIDAQTVKMAEEFKLEPMIAALNGGEDYELLFTINPEDYEKLKEESFISVIGHITEQEEGAYMISASGQEITLQAQGWNPLEKKE